MKIAFYIEDGLEQIVLTPQTDTEKGIVGKLHDANREMSVHQGGFYGCQGGWWRHDTGPFGVGQKEDRSTIIVLRPAVLREPETP